MTGNGFAKGKRTAKKRGPNHAGMKNLKPVKPGEVRNPKGINGYDFRKRMVEFYLERIVAPGARKGAKGVEVERFVALQMAMFDNALRIGTSGDHSRKLILEQLQGKATERHEVSGPNGGPLDVGAAPPMTSAEKRKAVMEIIREARARVRAARAGAAGGDAAGAPETGAAGAEASPAGGDTGGGQ